MKISISDGMIARATALRGNNARLQALFRRAEAGEPLTLGVLGGSITAGAKADSPDGRYANRFADFLRRTFPHSAVTLVNAGIGATGSAIGAYRLQEHLLAYRPDLVIVEYAVNDGPGMAFINRAESDESILRRCLEAGAAVVSLLLPRMDRRDAGDVQRTVASRYGVPVVDVISAVEPCFDGGNLQWSDYGADAVHPNDDGHALIAQLLGEYVQSVRAEAPDAAIPLPPIAVDRLHNAAMWDNTLPTETCGCFVPDPTGYKQFQNAWRADAPGAPLVFKRTCRTAMLLVRRSILPEYGVARVRVAWETGCVEHIVDARFPNGWGDYPMPVPIFQSDAPTEITVTVTVEQGAFLFLRLMDS